jgi:small subunit ribosomal protein S19
MSIPVNLYIMPRAAWKGPFFKLSLLNQVNSLRKSASSSLNTISAKTTARSSTILPQMVGVTLEVHNGKNFVPLTVREEMVGRRLGEMVACKKPFTFRQTNAGKKVKK